VLGRNNPAATAPGSQVLEARPAALARTLLDRHFGRDVGAQFHGKKGIDVMNLSNVSGSGDASAVGLLQALETQASSDSAGVVGVGTTTSISSFASVLNALQQLQQSSPDEFKKVMAGVASTLQTDASNVSGPPAQFLNQLADQFQQAAQTGSMPSLQQAGSSSSVPGPRHHHHRHHGVQSYGAQQACGSIGAGEQSVGGDATQQAPLDLARVIQGALQQVSTS